jgi:hypothetical protein
MKVQADLWPDGLFRRKPISVDLTTDNIHGESAEQNMNGFDFQNTWQVVTGDYPALSWEDL